MRSNRKVTAVLLAASMLVSACASLEQFVSPPEVSLSRVEVQSLDLSAQTFLLSFDVNNPNPFPLPVRTISYSVELDGQRFASGEASSAFTVPAGSDGAFSISVDLNLLQTAPELLFVVRDAVRREIPYALEGSFGVDIPYAPPVTFVSAGDIRLRSSAF